MNTLKFNYSMQLNFMKISRATKIYLIIKYSRQRKLNVVIRNYIFSLILYNIKNYMQINLGSICNFNSPLLIIIETIC